MCLGISNKKEVRACFCTLGGSLGCYGCEVYQKHMGSSLPTYEEFKKSLERENENESYVNNSKNV